MQRDFEGYLWDVHEAGRDILEFTSGKTLIQYAAEKQLSRSVERSFEIIGEALVEAKHHFPEQTLQITSAIEIIAFRNMLAHRYRDIVHELVWDIIHTDLLRLMAEVSVLLDEWHQG